MPCAVAALASHLKPATPPPLPAHASTDSSSCGRGRTRLRARTRWLCRAYPKGHSWRRTHWPWPRVLSHCRLAVVATYEPRCTFAHELTQASSYVFLALALPPLASSSSEHLFCFDRCFHSRRRPSQNSPSLPSPPSHPVQTSPPSSQTTKRQWCLGRAAGAPPPLASSRCMGCAAAARGSRRQMSRQRRGLTRIGTLCVLLLCILMYCCYVVRSVGVHACTRAQLVALCTM